jgi:hypothetical protein
MVVKREPGKAYQTIRPARPDETPDAVVVGIAEDGGVFFERVTAKPQEQP